ncbi:hypothetical protein [Granulicella arctica]|uniref:hypothetical protein n=1 Tax=Granulicella arctica TaxID=940613 RepID=UPI0021DF8737|nr:hypothetical protein [Granulicella arctica]
MAKLSQAKPTSLQAQEHQQVLDFLVLADKSQNPDIRKAAIEIARNRDKHNRKQGAKMSATQVVIFGTSAVLLAVAASWFAILHYPRQVAWEIIGCVSSCLLIVIALYTLVSGHLSQTNFVKLLQAAFKRMAPTKLQPANSLEGQLASSETSASSDGKRDA